MIKTIYIAGPMTGRPLYNFPAFDSAASALRALGWRVLSPADLDRDVGFDPCNDKVTPDFMSQARLRDTAAIEQSDALMLLDGWEDSKGARAERAYAEWKGISIFTMDDQLPDLSRPPSCKLVAFIGPKGCGKTSLCNLLEDQDTVRLSFATPLRSMLEAIGVTYEYHTENKSKAIPHIPGNPSSRHLLQTLGTEWGRRLVHPEIWADLAIKAFTDKMNQGQDVVVDDLRFPNEFDAVRNAGGVIVRILPSQSLFYGDDQHESERHWKEMEPDHEILNYSSLAHLLNEYKELGI